MCVYCGNIYKNHFSELPNASEILRTGVIGTNQDLANYLTTGFWSDFGETSRKFNLTNSGVFAKNGVITYNTTSNVLDADGISSERSLLVDESFRLIENTFGIDFKKTTNLNADIRFSDYENGAYSYLNYSSGNIDYANINISKSWNGSLNGFGNYTFQTILHEIGHALGLGHQGNYNGSGSYINNANYINDSWQSSTMSYFSQSVNTYTDASFAYLSSFSAVDLIALEDLYSPQGFSSSYSFAGDTTYGFNTNISNSKSLIFSELTNWISSTAFTISDGNGNDTLDFSGFSNNQTIDLRSTDKTSSSLFASSIAGLTGNLVISAGTIIENAFGGSGNDTIIGNPSNNKLNGGSGNDLLVGGPGDDTYIIDSISDTVNENLNEGDDLIIASISYTLPNNLEKITLTGSSDIDAIGNDLDNVIKGNSGTNEINGKLGTDIIIFDGLYDEYSFSLNYDNLVIEDDRLSSPNGTTIIENVEIIEFSDFTKTINELLNSLRTITLNNYEASDLNFLDTNSTENIDALAVNLLSGSISELNSAYSSSGINGLGNEDIVISDIYIDASLLVTLDNNTTGIIDASTLSALTGNISEINSAYESSSINGLGDESIIINDIILDASLINILDKGTTGGIDASTVSTLTGNISEINSAYRSSSINGLGDESIIISDTSLFSTTLSALDANTTGGIDVSTVSTLTGNISEINSTYESSSINGLGDESIIISDTSLFSTTLNTLDANTTGIVNAGSVTSLAGTLETLSKAYNSSSVTGLGDEAVTLSDTEISATLLNTLDGKTTGAIDASKLTKITGTGTDAKTAFESAGISGLTFDASNYLASYSDLLTAFGNNLETAKSHYFANGVSEGRSFDAFDETSYLASYSDLLGAFGTNTDKALIHYINNGFSEGRTVSFDGNSYLASNTSLIGSTSVADAAAHYVNTGYAAGLATDSFDELSYLASNTSLIGSVSVADATKHYVETGYAAGNAADSFDEFGYIASYSDLIEAFGSNGAAGTQHFIDYGSTEGRTVSFNASEYLAAYADLRAAFGTDQEAAKKHYITNGFNEGRTFPFDSA